MGYASLIAGCIFISNPLINIVDILPDCIGYLLILIGISDMSYADSKTEQCRRKIRILLFLSFGKLLLSVFALGGSERFEFLGDSTMVLTYTFCFAIAEPIIMCLAASSFFDGLYRLGIREGDTESAVLYRIKAKSGKRLRIGDTVRRLTFWFILVRSAVSLLPQFIFITDVSYLEYDIYGVFMDVRDAFPVLAVLSVLLMLPLSIVWCVKICRYLQRIRREGVLDAEIQRRLSAMRGDYALHRQQNTFRDGFLLLFIGCVFFFHLNFAAVNYLPAPVGVAICLLALLILRGDMKPSKKTLLLGFSLLPVSALSYACSFMTARAYYSGTWQPLSFAQWQKNALPMLAAQPLRFLRNCGLDLIAEDQVAWDAQLIAFLLCILQSLLLVLFLNGLLHMMHAFVQDGGDILLHRFCRETRTEEQTAQHRLNSQPRWIFVFFCLFMAFSALCEHPFFVFYLTPLPALRAILGLVFLLVLYRYMRALRCAVTE